MADFQQVPSPSFGVRDPNALSLTTLTQADPTDASLKKPSAIYDGGISSATETEVLLRIGNGGAGQIGLIGALANAFIQDWVSKGNHPFKVAWYLGDTTDSIQYLADGIIDIAVTYNGAAERAALKSGIATERGYAFRDHFLFVGPPSNPANLLDNDDIRTMFYKIAASGNRDIAVPPDHAVRPPTRFLSRFDKSATNIKESQLFIEAGQVPWTHTYSRWYHQYPQYPLKALAAAAVLSEYTLTDWSTWTTSPDSVKSALRIFKSGSDDDPDDPLLNPAHALYGARTPPAHTLISKAFMNWLVALDGGQEVIRTFYKNGQRAVSEAPQ